MVGQKILPTEYSDKNILKTTDEIELKKDNSLNVSYIIDTRKVVRNL